MHYNNSPIGFAHLAIELGGSELAFIKIRHRREADMRVRAHVDTLFGDEFRRSHLVEEHEGADHLPSGRWQRAAHFEVPDVAGAGDDQRLDRIDVVHAGENRF